MVAAPPIAYLLIRQAPHYRREAFERGLRAVGFEVTDRYPNDIRKADAVVMWNRYGHVEMAAVRAERAGARVLVAENGYLGRDAAGRQNYALALNGHNGSGRWPIGGRDRWDGLGIPLQPWRTGGKHLVVREQRGIGTPLMASPPNWHGRMAADLQRMTRRPVIIRHHPAKAPEQPPLEAMLEGAHALVTWASSDAGRALAMGVPVFYSAPHLVCADACRRLVDGWTANDIENPLRGDRVPAMTALAWAQWSVDEISGGEPFRRLLEM